MKILASFVDPRQAFGPDKVIPPQILANAKVIHIHIPQSPNAIPLIGTESGVDNIARVSPSSLSSRRASLARHASDLVSSLLVFPMGPGLRLQLW